MRFWQLLTLPGVVVVGAACSGSSAAPPIGTGGSSEGDGSIADSSSSAGGSAGTAGASGSSPGGGSASTGGSSGANVGSGGNTVMDASLMTDSGGSKKDGGRTGADGGCSQAAEDKCDTCTEKHCCAQLDMCDANLECKRAFAAIDGCIGDAGSAAVSKQCYKTFGDTQGTGQTAKNLVDCIIAQCPGVCHP